MTVTISLTEDQIMIAVRQFLLAVVPGDPVPIVQGQVNRVPEVKGPDFIVFWPTYRKRLATNIDSDGAGQEDPEVVDHQQNTQVDVQLDIHGERGADLAQAIATLWRDQFVCNFFAIDADPPVPIDPLYSDDGHQVPFINENQQFENRWVLTLSLQANPVVSTAQQFADTVALDVFEVDAEYAPEP